MALNCCGRRSDDPPVKDKQPTIAPRRYRSPDPEEVDKAVPDIVREHEEDGRGPDGPDDIQAFQGKEHRAKGQREVRGKEHRQARECLCGWI